GFGPVRDLEYAGTERVGRTEVVEQQVDVAEDGGQHVVEVVRDGTSQTADRFHLLRLPHLRRYGGWFPARRAGRTWNAQFSDNRPSSSTCGARSSRAPS